MIFPSMPKGVERDDTVHGKLYYTRDDMRRFGLQCVEEYKRCQNKPAAPFGSGSDVVDELMGFIGGMGKR